MGSPLSPVIAIILQDLEMKALKIFGIEIPFYYKYVDNIAMAVPHTQLSRLLDIFNSFHLRIQFIIEIGGDKLNFLDVTIINNNNIIEFDWYQKPTFSGSYINFRFLHISTKKKGSIMSITDRTIFLSHQKYYHVSSSPFLDPFLGQYI